MLVNVLGETLIQLRIQMRRTCRQGSQGLRHKRSRRLASSLERNHLLQVRQRKLRAYQGMRVEETRRSAVGCWKMEKFPEDEFSCQCILLTSDGSCWLFPKAMDLPLGSTMGKGSHPFSLGCWIFWNSNDSTSSLSFLAAWRSGKHGGLGVRQVVLPLGLSFSVCKLGLA